MIAPILSAVHQRARINPRKNNDAGTAPRDPSQCSQAANSARISSIVQHIGIRSGSGRPEIHGRTPVCRLRSSANFHMDTSCDLSRSIVAAARPAAARWTRNLHTANSVKSPSIVGALPRCRASTEMRDRYILLVPALFPRRRKGS